MKSLFNKIKSKFDYPTESIKNRYPCKIIKIENYDNPAKDTLVTYQAITRHNLRRLNLDEILNDPMLIEKFHPTDGVKLGFLSAGEIFLKNKNNIENLEQKYYYIIKKMFNEAEE